MTDLICPVCEGPAPHAMCPNCSRELVEAVRARRDQIVNDAMQKIEKEADEVFEADPTRGRGRGPKWME
jgi:hypothetical protein